MGWKARLGQAFGPGSIRRIKRPVSSRVCASLPTMKSSDEAGASACPGLRAIGLFRLFF